MIQSFERNLCWRGCVFIDPITLGGLALSAAGGLAASAASGGLKQGTGEKQEQVSAGSPESQAPSAGQINRPKPKASSGMPSFIGGAGTTPSTGTFGQKTLIGQ